ncbi:hypothetical protein DX932_18420 [Bacillus cereus]|uniref:Uncharacterized protein n=1 Tax=Bacillus cereus TaxID=1396 RepID=A0A9W7Q3I5_BACCE|nr:hypothetical protein [Bacillus cereus]KAA6462292.1 hypothetical protein DX932_18420 [Bacillus cereus]KAB2506048.1 hypothetical protein F8156_02095 [Bacillus cereus]
MKRNSNDIKRMENLIPKKYSWECDPIYTRLFKSENDYLIEGYKTASDVYDRIITGLNLEFEKWLFKLEVTDIEKQRLIEHLILAISKLRKDSSNEYNDERMKLLIRCLDVFNEDANSYSSNEMKHLPLDKEFSDWRHVYDISKKY